jgi:predicted nucleotidyltransferase
MAAVESDLIDRVRRCLNARPEILEAYVFGSAARVELQPHSDVEVAVFAPEKVSAAPFGYPAELAGELMAALDEDRVDVVVPRRGRRGAGLAARFAPPACRWRAARGHNLYRPPSRAI